MKNKLIIYGDIHGCYDEFISLRNKINISKEDIEICVGDVITKGYNSIKVLDFLIENGIKSVLGNHEDKLLRYLYHEKQNYNNPIKLNRDEKNIISNLNNKHLSYLQKIPLYLKIGNITIVHGGLQNDIDLNNISSKDKQKILRVRYLDKNQNFISYGKEDKNSVFWSDVYTGKEGFVIFGHQNFKEVKISSNAIGIDTGCVYGNKLSAIVFSNKNNISDYIIYNQNYIINKI